MPDDNITEAMEINGVAESLTPSADLKSLKDLATPKTDENVSNFTSRPFRHYTRRKLIDLSKSSLVALPPGMPPLKEWFGEWEPHNSPRKDNDHHSSNQSSARASRATRRDAGDDDSRIPFKGQFAQISQMGSFRHHPSRLDERADRETHERLRNLSDTYDRNKLLASGSSSRRDSAARISTASRKGDTDRDGREREVKERPDTAPWDRRDNPRGERSGDWRRGNTESDEIPTSERRANGRVDRTGRPRSRSRDGTVASRNDRAHRNENGAGERDRTQRHARGRSPSPTIASTVPEADRYIPPRSAWDRHRSRSRSRGEGDDQDRRISTRARGRDTEDRDEKRPSIVSNGNNRRSARESDRDVDRRGDSRLSKDQTPRDKVRERGEKEPAWMEEYVADKSEQPMFGSSKEGQIDELQAWKQDLREKERTTLPIVIPKDSAGAVQSSPDGPDNTQASKLHMKLEEQRSRTSVVDEGKLMQNAPSDLPPGLDLGDSCTVTPLPSVNTKDGVTILASGHRTSDISPVHAVQSPLAVAGISSDYEPGADLSRLSNNSEPQPSIESHTLTPVGPQGLASDSSRSGLHSPNTAALSTASEYSGTQGARTSPAPFNNNAKGSRFAKFWDSKNKEVPVQSMPAVNLNSPTNIPAWSVQSFGDQDSRSSRSFTQPERLSTAPSKSLDGLLQNLSFGDRINSPNQPYSSVPENDRMQNLLSMLNSQQPPNAPIHGLERPDQRSQMPLTQDTPQGFTHPIPRMQQQQQQQQHQQQYPSYTSQSSPYPFNSFSSDVERFVPDGLVPGLRPQRNRDSRPNHVPQSIGTPNPLFGDEERHLYSRPSLQINVDQSRSLQSGYAANGLHGPLRMLGTPPAQLNVSQQSTNNVQQTRAYSQSLARSPYDVGINAGSQPTGMNLGTFQSQQYGGSVSNGSGGMMGQSRAQAFSNLSYSVAPGVPNMADLTSLPPREHHSRSLMGNHSISVRDVESGRLHAGMPPFQSHQPPPQHVLQQAQFPSTNGHAQSFSYGPQGPSSFGQQLPQQQPLASRPLSYGPGPSQRDPVNGPYPGQSSVQQGQPDLMALLMGGTPFHRE